MSISVVPEQDKESLQDDNELIVVPMEPKQEKEEEEAEKLKMEEFGKPVCYCKLLSLATWHEMRWLGLGRSSMVPLRPRCASSLET